MPLAVLQEGEDTMLVGGGGAAHTVVVVVTAYGIHVGTGFVVAGGGADLIAKLRG